MSRFLGFLIVIVVFYTPVSESAASEDQSLIVPEGCRPTKIECWAGDRDNFDAGPGPSETAVTIHQYRINGLACREQKTGPFQGMVFFDERPNSFTRLRDYHEDHLRVPDNPWLQQRLLERVSLRSGPLVQGDIMPINGVLYTVDRCQRSEEQQGMASISLSRIQREKWPNEIQCDDYAYAVTPGGYMYVPRVGFAGYGEIHVEWDESKRELQLRILHDVVTSNGNSEAQEQLLVARPGLPFALAAAYQIYHFQVVSVVRPELDSHIPGWVELRRVWPAIPAFGVPGAAAKGAPAE